MKRPVWVALVSMGLVGLLLAAAPSPRYLEELAIGGGFGDPADGGALFQRDGDILTDGTITAGAASSDGASLTLPHGTAPASPGDGDLWTTTAGLFSHIDGTTRGPLLDSTNIPWDAPGAIGSTTPNSGAFTSGNFSEAVLLSGSSPSLLGTDAVQMLITNQNSSGAASIRFTPKPDDGVGNATVDFFRVTNTTGYVAFLVKKGNGTNTTVFEVKASTSQPRTYFRDASGIVWLTVEHDTGNLDASGDANFDGGDLLVGTDGGTRGVVTAWSGSGGSAPGTLKLASPDGTAWHLFVEDDGTLKVHNALPTQNSDGTEIGSQS